MKKYFFVICLFLPSISYGGAGTATPMTYTGLHWSIQNLNGFAGCAQMTNIYLDATTGDSSIMHVSGLAVCNTSSGKGNVLITGTGVILSSGLALALYIDDYRISCTLPLATLTSTACALFNIASEAQTNNFSMAYAP